MRVLLPRRVRRHRAAHEREGGWEAVLGCSAGERERGPAERVEGQREAGDVVAELELVEAGGRGDERERRDGEEVDAVERLLRVGAVGRAGGAGHRVLFVGHGQAAVELRPDVGPVEVAVLGEELPVDVDRLAHERGAAPVVEREVEPAASREESCAASDAAPNERVRLVQPGDPELDLLEGAEPLRVEPGDEDGGDLRALGDGSRHGPGVVEARREREAPSVETSPKVGLKPTMPQQAAGMRIDPPLSVPSAASAMPATSAAAEPPLDPPGIRPGNAGLTASP